VIALDIIIFAVVAAFIFWRYRSVLGQRSDDDVTRPPPSQTQSHKGKDDGVVILDRGQFREVRPTPPAPAPESLAGALAAISAKEKDFSEKSFLAGARQAFGIIVTAFAEGNTETLRRFLDDTVFATFERTIKTRQQRGETVQFTLEDIRTAELLEAKLDGDAATIKVEILSEQQQILRDAAGTIIEGDPDRINEVRDIWSFRRTLGSNDPTWRLVATKAS
jgi:predicted lipid-binding transport protein (Tim44 family)